MSSSTESLPAASAPGLCLTDAMRAARRPLGERAHRVRVRGLCGIDVDVGVTGEDCEVAEPGTRRWAGDLFQPVLATTL